RIVFKMALIVAKFGGTSVADIERIERAAEKVAREVEAGHNVAVVVSAMSGVTNQLVGYCSEISNMYDLREYDVVVSSGEQVTAGLMAMALQKRGVPARSWLGWQIPFKTNDVHGKARMTEIETDELHQRFEMGEVVVVPGFQGVTEANRISTLGRGGSDTSAVAIAAAPFDELVNQLNLKRDLSRNPLFDVFVILQGTELQYEAPADFEGLTILPYEGKKDVYSYFDLTLVFADGADFLFTFEYNSDIFLPETAKRMARHFEQLISAVVEQPDVPIRNLDFLNTEEQQTLIQAFNQTEAEYPSQQTFLDLFEERVKVHPEKTALVFEGKPQSYAVLHQQANRLANHLLVQGLEPAALVAICLDRSVEMIVALLAVAKAGAAYIPLDPNYPLERIHYIIEDAQSQWTISEKNYQSLLPQQAGQQLILMDQHQDQIKAQSSETPTHRPSPNDLVYVIYTSGSTGHPKGVMIEHRALLNFLCSMQKQLDMSEAARLLAVTTYSFDIAYLELYLPLITGAQIILAGSETTADGYFLQELLQHSSPTHLQATPATWQLLLDCGWTNAEQLVILSGGEAISEALKNKLCALSEQPVWNLYGPTETTIWSSASQLLATEPVHIGRPIANTQIYILDTSGPLGTPALAPIGVAGELCIGGAGLARGYLNRPELSAEKFIANPFVSGQKLYRTGDLAKWLPNGAINYLGRIDHQVKVRGYRIEPGEIEATLQKHESIKQAIVVARPDSMGSNRLLAYCQGHPNQSALDKGELQRWLKTQLPTYMIPSIFIELSEWPLTPNGKINRLALPDPDAQVLINPEYCAPRNEIETQLAEIWQNLLVIDRIGVHDDFFLLGGHSLLATRVISNIRKTFAIKLPIRTLFELTTIAELAQQLADLQTPSTPVSFDNKLII
ncbi:MAG: amino acid adenylation domain-containing protein, partial [Bacteroidota bacterium]